MEKIYMEENNNKKGKRSVVDASVVLSFVVAIFAIFSIAMTGLSLNQKTGVSYAAPTANNFTFNLLNNGDKVLVADSTRTGGEVYSVPMYVADNNANDPIFCVEKTADVEDGKSYTKGDEITDYGLLYLLNKSYANGVAVTDATGSNAKYVEGWVTQTAIWVYLYEKYGGAANEISAGDLSDIKNTKQLRLLNQANGVSEIIYTKDYKLYDKYVKPLVDAAKSAKNVAILNVSKASDEIAKSEDGNYYYSSLITVTGDPSSALKGYSITLDGIDGAKVIGEDGKELTGPIAPGTKFYVRIPADKVTKEIQKVTVSVNGTFTALTGRYFNAASGSFQKVVSVAASEKTVSEGTVVEFVGTDDTGMNTAQTIYFIGLIVLLCGIGIVYANAKPVQVKQ